MADYVNELRRIAVDIRKHQVSLNQLRSYQKLHKKLNDIGADSEKVEQWLDILQVKAVTNTASDKYFDVVFASAVLKHIRHADRAAVYAEFARVADHIIVSELNSAADGIEEHSGFKFYHSDFTKELKDYFDEVELMTIGDNILGLYRVRV